MTISSQWFTLGTIFRVEGSSEVQISSQYNGTLRFVSGDEEICVAVVITDTGNDFDFSPDIDAGFWKPEYHNTQEVDFSPGINAGFWKPDYHNTKEVNFSPDIDAVFWKPEYHNAQEVDFSPDINVDFEITNS